MGSEVLITPSFGILRRTVENTKTLLSDDSSMMQNYMDRFKSLYNVRVMALFDEFLTKEALGDLRVHYPWILSMPLDKLGLSSGVTNGLKRFCGPTVEHILVCNSSTLMCIPGVGPKRILEIEESIDNLFEKALSV